MGEYKKMAEALSDLCSDLKKKISELENDLEEKDSKISKLESELSVESVLKSDNTLSRETLIGVNVNGINKTYSIEKISEIVRAYEDIQYCKEHAGEHLHSEEYLKIIHLRQEIDSLRRNSSKKDELIKTMKDDLKEAKKRVGKANDQHQSDCITINELHVTIDTLCDKYSRLREIH